MGNNVIPRQLGDAYQARFFWMQASKLFQPGTKAVKVEWESTSSSGFDDVIVHYNPAKLDHGENVTVENFQLKFHVDQQQGISIQALIDPSFIRTTSDTILKRLYRLYIQSPEEYCKSRFYLVNTWGLDSRDGLGKYIGNGGAIILERLFDDSTDASAAGRIRKAWRDHLEMGSDDELRAVLKPLRIWHSYPDMDGIIDQLNDRLQLAGLKPIEADRRTTVYHDLIQRLHAEGRNVFTKEELIEICRREDLIASPSEECPDVHIIGVRSFRRGAESLELEVKDLVCLLHHFSSRYLLEESSWDEVYPQIADLASRALAVGKPLHVHLDTHLSIAFCLGYCLDFKFGVQVSIIQKTLKGKLVWTPEPEKLVERQTGEWDWREMVINTEGWDLVLALGVTHDIAEQVEEFTRTHLADTGKIIFGSIRPRPSTTVIRDATHIIATVQELIRHARPEVTKMRPGAVVHVFMAAPNAFAFFLGQQSRPLGRLVLYEYDFDRLRTGNYEAAIALPISVKH